MQETIHQAATAVLVREQKQEGRLEVYMTKRPATMRFLASHYVYPGGKMDASDQDPRFQARSAPLTSVLNPIDLPLSYWVTAIRETFEEVGILLARDASGRYAAQDDFQQQRERMLSGEISLYDIITEANLELATDQLRYFGHRLTPRKVSSTRFATRFFLMVLPDDLEPDPHPEEIAEAGWYDAKQALSGWQRGDMLMVPPTVDSLRVIDRFATAGDIWLASDGVGTPTPEELA